jgi:hypothetical protein
LSLASWGVRSTHVSGGRAADWLQLPPLRLLIEKAGSLVVLLISHHHLTAVIPKYFTKFVMEFKRLLHVQPVGSDLPSSWFLLQLAASEKLWHCKTRKYEASKIFIHRDGQRRHLTHYPRHLVHGLQKTIDVPSCPMEEFNIVLRLEEIVIRVKSM